MQNFIQISLVSLQIGAVYILFSLGLTLIFGVMKIINFAHGQVFTLSAIIVAVMLPMLTGWGWSPPVAFAASAVVALLSSVSLGFVMFQYGFRFYQRNLVGSFILSLGFVLLLEGIYLDVFGGQVRSIPPLITGTVDVFGAPMTTQRLVLCVAAIVFTLILYFALAKTRTGKALRAASIDHEAAMLQGIPYERIALQGFLIAALLAGVAGILIAPTSAVTTTIGTDYLLKGFIAVIIGGLGSVPGAIVGSLFVAFIEGFGGFYFDPSGASIAVFVLVMVVLVVRPKGLMGNV
ncbi:branched-chain amino acid ABC transporter permease [Hoeflea sp. G2-23]|uniref:Branched-chain amino acid ABC transporter permease n=1 Tax=Hoeflea algicola TaxID=2983763 RepID=A0ABT3ZBT2_9HYPH|nr:branched-chain amino acid ABC transporter permease [Hoeflea algicola]MCY0149263.1 branched-chain amino acid ABC transporter permease [Hoeflea algicola]